MGHTHYWEPKPISKDNWSKITKAVELVFKECNKHGTLLTVESNSKSPPIVSEELIQFNGSTFENGHETFIYGRKAFNSACFCKTARKDYDIAVVAVLGIIEHFSGNQWSSDGDDEDLIPGLKLAQKIINETKSKLKFQNIWCVTNKSNGKIKHLCHTREKARKLRDKNSQKIVKISLLISPE